MSASMQPRDDASPLRGEPPSSPVTDHHFSRDVKVVEVRRSGQGDGDQLEAAGPPGATAPPDMPRTP